MKKLILFILLISFAKISKGGCGMSCSYTINQSSTTFISPYINSSYNIYINSGDSVRFFMGVTGGSGCLYCIYDHVYWTFNGFAASDTQFYCAHYTQLIAHNPGIYVVHLNWDYFPLQTITFNVILNPVAVSENSFQNILNVHPNPFTDNLSITIQKQNMRELSFFIRNVLGQTVLTERQKNPTNIYKKEIDLNGLLKGIYFLEADIDGDRIVKKIVKE